MKCIFLFLCSLSSLLFPLYAQRPSSDVIAVPEMNYSSTRREVIIPGFDGYIALKGDFHTHTIFSDGAVLPKIRVQEAWSEGLDVIAITDHIEYRPHKKWLKGGLNDSFDQAKEYASSIGFTVIKGAEITRSKPFGHMNALFITNAELLVKNDPLSALDEALKQGAFIQWNHPGWPDKKSTLYDVHKKLISEKKIHGVEDFNHLEYYPKVISWANEYKLAHMANSDIHSLVSTQYGPGQMRPFTIVFASANNEPAIKEALLAGRTIACFNETLVSNPALMKKFVSNAIKLRLIKSGEKEDIYEVTNLSDITFDLRIAGFALKLLPRTTVRRGFPKGELVVFSNCLIEEGQALSLQFPWD